MDEPRMLYQECEFDREDGEKDKFVTLATQFLPTFETRVP